MRPVSDPGVDARAARQTGLCISVVTVDELVFGLRRRGRPRLDAWFDRSVDQLRVLDITPPIPAALASCAR